MMNRRHLLASLCAAPALLAQARTDEEEVWMRFLEWNSGRPPGITPPQHSYRDLLMSEGMPAWQVNEHVSVIENRLIHRPDGMRHWFNKVYASDDAVFNPAPNAFLSEAVRDLPPGKALDVAMGQGRNSIFLALKGWEVTGFDVSDVGLAAARAGAARAGVKIDAVLSGHRDFDFGRNRWDLVIMMYAYVPVGGSGFAERLTASLRPNGVLVFEHFLRGAGKWDGVIPGMPGPNELLQRFKGLRIIRYEDTTAKPDWGKRKSTPVVRLLARKR